MSRSTRTLLSRNLIPFDKSWIIRMGVLDAFNGYDNIFVFLKKHRKQLPHDLLMLQGALLAWHHKKQNIPVGESGTLYRFLLYASWIRQEKKKFILQGTLRKRMVAKNPEMVHYSLSRLLQQDKATSQWASAAVLFGNKERIKDPPFKLKVTYEALRHWKKRRKEGKVWEARYDKTILHQAETFLALLQTQSAVFVPEQAEDYCFARAFGFITRKKGEALWPSLRGHESDRVVEMEKMLTQIEKRTRITSKDHRIVQAGAMRQRLKGIPINVQHPSCVKKSWPQFWKFLKEEK
jgi:hypothetical protein